MYYESNRNYMRKLALIPFSVNINHKIIKELGKQVVVTYICIDIN